MKKYDLNNLGELGRILFALGYAEYGYKNLSDEKQARIASGWDVEFKRNKVRMLKRYESKEVPASLSQYVDQPCINVRSVDAKLVKKIAMVAGYV
jgi:hypothetical protein